MISDEEKIEIINLAVEKAILMIPEIVGNMMANHAALNKMNSEFYAKYPEFKDKKDIVASVIEMVDGKNPLLKYEDLLERAVPEIRERIKTVQNLNTLSITKNPSRDFSKMNINGAL